MTDAARTDGTVARDGHAEPQATDTGVPGACRTDADCKGGSFCAGPLRCGPDGVCAYFLTRLPCNDDQRCTDDICEEATRSCRFVVHPERCQAGRLCVPYQGCVAPDGGS